MTPCATNHRLPWPRTGAALAVALLSFGPACDSTGAGHRRPPRPESRLDVAVACEAGEQMVPHVAATRDGGPWISFYATGGPPGASEYRMRLQGLDPAGEARLRSPGVLVSDEPSRSWVTDYALASARDGSAIVAFSDLRNGDQFDITAYRVSAAGTQLWGEAGVPVGASPRDDATARLVQDGDETVLAWERFDDLAPGVVVLQRLGADGTRLWGDGIELAAPPPGAAVRPRLAVTTDGAVVVTWFETPTPDTADNHRVLLASKLDSRGLPSWPGPVVVSDPDGSIPFAANATVVADDAGGAFVAWTRLGDDGRGEVRVQHLGPDGLPSMPAGGLLPADPTAGEEQRDPVIAPLPGAAELVVGWRVTRSEDLRYFNGLALQRLTKAGARAYGDAGAALVPLALNESWGFVGLRARGDELFAFHARIADDTGASLLLARLSSATGGAVEPEPMPLSTDVGPKFHFDVSEETDGGFWIVWQDRRADRGDIYGSFVQTEAR